jgi:pSer/pThr/pTyr-binding forkhead associated (FHA) protein
MKVSLLVVHGRPRGKSLQFPHGEFVIGRGKECHVRPNSDWVSRQHCLLCVTEDAVHLRDLGSTNGTLVNGRRILVDQPLQDGDQLQIGPLVFEVHLEALPRSGAPHGLTFQPLETREVCLETQE